MAGSVGTTRPLLMPPPFRRPRLTVDRLLLAVLVAVVVLAASVGHNGHVVPRATADEPVSQATAELVAAPATPPPPASPVVHLPAGSSEVLATAAPNHLQAPAPARKWLPSGKGMWIYEPAKTEGGDVAAIVAKAKATGLTHLWVRMGSAWDGFNVAPFVDRLLPAALAADIKVIGWDFP